MLTVQVRLLHGTIRASSEDIALTGEADPGEWPPSPARLVAALVAGDGTRARCRVTTGDELRLFERAGPPRIHASPRSEVLGSRMNQRFVVVNDTAENAVQEYPGRLASPVRPGTRLAPKDPRIAYVWPDIDPSADELLSLSARAARVGYIGCADSPARVTVGLGMPVSSAPETLWEPDAAGDVSLPVPSPGFIDSLDRFYDEWQAKSARRSWYPPLRVRYGSPDRAVLAAWESRWSYVVWLRLSSPLPGATALRVTETLKKAVLDLYQRHTGYVAQVLHGHGFGGARGYQHGQFLALPDAGHEHATGSIHGAAVMLPAGTDPLVVEGLRAALWHAWPLDLPGREPVEVRPHTGERRPWAAYPMRWTQPSTRWISVLPAVHERRRRGGPTADDVALWCRHAELPEPVVARVSRVPLVPGSPALRAAQVFRARDGIRRPYSYLDIEFPREVQGPVVLGRARQFGLGLMMPLHANRAERG